MLKIIHISDMHGYKYHEATNIPECDVLICSGDVGDMRTSLAELTQFLIWFEAQPARLKIFVAGNHDVCLDKLYPNQQTDSIARMLAKQTYQDAKILIESYKIKYLENKEYVFEGVKFYGSPYSPSFGTNWAFNADRGAQIKSVWARIPSDVNVLITHTPVYGILDLVEDRYKRFPGEDMNVGYQDLLNVIKKRLHNLKLHCCGHIHDGPVGCIWKKVSNTRYVQFSNGAVINNDGDHLIKNPLIITI